jgi:hypothetical protein
LKLGFESLCLLAIGGTCVLLFPPTGLVFVAECEDIVFPPIKTVAFSSSQLLAQLLFSRLFFSGRILISKGERLIEAGMGQRRNSKGELLRAVH